MKDMESPGKVSLEELVLRASKGDSAAFEELMSRYCRLVYCIIFEYGIRHPNAEDVFQNVWLKAFRFLPNLEIPSKFPSWLSGITKFSSLEFYKSSKKWPMSASLLSGDCGCDDDSNNLLQEYEFKGSLEEEGNKEIRLEIVRECISLLEEIYREVILRQSEYENMTQDEIAHSMGISRSAFVSRLARAKPILSKCIDRKWKSLGTTRD